MLSVLTVHTFKSGVHFQSDYADAHSESNNGTGCTNHLFGLHCANKMLS